MATGSGSCLADDERDVLDCSSLVTAADSIC
jgi:hypothetical protein